MKKRFRTLLPPYLIWNVIFVLWYVALEMLPFAGRWINGGGWTEHLLHQSVWQTVYDLWLAPAGFHLWFLRDLLGMVALTPVLCFWAKRHWLSALIAALVSTAFCGWLVYFWAGIILAMQGVDIEHYPRPRWAMSVCSLLFFAYALYFPLCGAGPHQLEVLSNLAGLYVLWRFYDLAARDQTAQNGLWKWLCGYSFFIYLFHEPTFNIIKKLTLAVCGRSEGALILLYYVNPWLMVLLGTAVAKVLKRTVPRIYFILTGGR